MRYYKCPRKNFFLQPDMTGTRRFCSGKLPCDRCLVKMAWKHDLVGEPECKPTLFEFDCDSCVYRWICMTNDLDSDSDNHALMPMYREQSKRTPIYRETDL